MRDTFSVPGTEISYQTNSIAFLSPPAPASPCNLFANQKFLFCPSVFYGGVEPLPWSQCWIEALIWSKVILLSFRKTLLSPARFRLSLVFLPVD